MSGLGVECSFQEFAFPLLGLLYFFSNFCVTLPKKRTRKKQFDVFKNKLQKLIIIFETREGPGYGC